MHVVYSFFSFIIESLRLQLAVYRSAKVEEQYPNILFAKDGEIYNFHGKKVMPIGGAYSVDKYYRIRNGLSWFESEQPDEVIKEYVEQHGIVDYCGKFASECRFSYGEDEFGNVFRRFPENSRFIKSEDILYEIKKIQQRQILSDGMEYDYMKNGHSQKRSRRLFPDTRRNQIEYIEFAQEKYSNDLTANFFSCPEMPRVVIRSPYLFKKMKPLSCCFSVN